MMIDGINQLPAPLFLPSQDIIESNHREIGYVWSIHQFFLDGFKRQRLREKHGKQTRYFYMYFYNRYDMV